MDGLNRYSRILGAKKLTGSLKYKDIVDHIKKCLNASSNPFRRVQPYPSRITEFDGFDSEWTEECRRFDVDFFTSVYLKPEFGV
jgi:hypothetical protein